MFRTGSRSFIKEKAGKGTNFEDMVAAIMCEFSMSLEEVYKLNNELEALHKRKSTKVKVED